MGCIVSAADRSLYILQCTEGVIFILVYVDDMLLIGKSVESLTVLVSSIARHFDIRREKSVSKFLGMVIQRDESVGTLTIHSEPTIRMMLEKFRMGACRSVSAPLATGTVLRRVAVNENVGRFAQGYKQLFGSLLHLANTTRPDIAFAAGYLSRYMDCAGKPLWEAAKRVLRYLSGTIVLVSATREMIEQAFMVILTQTLHLTSSRDGV